jgi:amidase
MEKTPGEEVGKYGLDWFIAARDEPFNRSSKEFQDAVQEMIRQGDAIKNLLDEADCDALVVPTTGDTPYDLGQNPGVAVPIGFYPADKKVSLTASGKVSKGPNIPYVFPSVIRLWNTFHADPIHRYSLTFLGRKWEDGKLIGLAYAFEQLTRLQPKAQHCVRPTGKILPRRTSSKM